MEHQSSYHLTSIYVFIISSVHCYVESYHCPLSHQTVFIKVHRLGCCVDAMDALV